MNRNSSTGEIAWLQISTTKIWGKKDICLTAGYKISSVPTREKIIFYYNNFVLNYFVQDPSSICNSLNYLNSTGYILFTIRKS